MPKAAIAVVITAVLTTALCYSLFSQAEAQPSPAPQPMRDHRDKGWIGISYAKDQWGGLELTHVHIGSPAWKAGLIRGDTIIGCEIKHNGQAVTEMKHGETVPFVLIGLETAPPETIFKLLIKRGETSKTMEKALAIDLPREKIEIPAAQGIVTHFQNMNKVWNQADTFWASVQSISYNDFTEHETKRLRYDVARLQVAELQERARNADLQRIKLIADIQKAIADRDLAVAQRLATELKTRDDSAIGWIGAILQIGGFLLGL